MTQEVVATIAAAVTTVVADRVVSKFLENLNRQMAADEKVQQLELALVRIHSLIEVSEKHTIKSTTLIQWREKLKEAASRGEEMLLSFKHHATDKAARWSSSNQHEAAETTLSFTSNMWSHMVWCIRITAAAIFSSDEDVKKLHGTVEALEKASENIGEFIELLKLDISSNHKRRHRTITTVSSSCFGDSPYVLTSTEELLIEVEDQELQELTKLMQSLSLG